MWVIITDHFAARPVCWHIGLCKSCDTNHSDLGCFEGILFTSSSTTYVHPVKLMGQVAHRSHWAIVQMSGGKLLLFNDDILEPNIYFL